MAQLGNLLSDLSRRLQSCQNWGPAVHLQNHEQGESSLEKKKSGLSYLLYRDNLHTGEGVLLGLSDHCSWRQVLGSHWQVPRTQLTAL